MLDYLIIDNAFYTVSISLTRIGTEPGLNTGLNAGLLNRCSRFTIRRFHVFDAKAVPGVLSYLGSG